jgi:hypothetical protein
LTQLENNKTLKQIRLSSKAWRLRMCRLKATGLSTC